MTCTHSLQTAKSCGYYTYDEDEVNLSTREDWQAAREPERMTLQAANLQGISLQIGLLNGFGLSALHLGISGD